MKIFLVCMSLVGLSMAYEYNDTDTNTFASLSCNCGWRNGGRIVGGKETHQNEYPWMVSLSNGCGGSIITPWHVLTAAHCTDQQRPSDIVISVGMHYLNAYTGNSQHYKLSKIIQHQNYNDRLTINDISILVTAQKIRYNQHVGPVCMPNKKVNLVGTYVKVMGWGLTKGTGSRNVLREVDVQIISTDSCRKYWSNVQTYGTQLCAYELKKDSCNGDSGGPLVYLDTETNRYTQAALVSYGDPNCGSTIMPSVNTDVSAYIDWINKAVSSSKQGERVCTRS